MIALDFTFTEQDPVLLHKLGGSELSGADSDAALTMQIFKHLAGTPVLFADVRHYHADLGVWDLCNSGEHATYFAAASRDPGENLPRVELKAQGFYFPAGGAAVYHVAAPGRVTLARLTRHDGRWMMDAFVAGAGTGNSPCAHWTPSAAPFPLFEPMKYPPANATIATAMIMRIVVPPPRFSGP